MNTKTLYEKKMAELQYPRFYAKPSTRFKLTQPQGHTQDYKDLETYRRNWMGKRTLDGGMWQLCRC